MKTGTVTGAIWSTKKCPGLTGQALLSVAVDGTTVIAADLVGAGRGERVLLAFGTPARQLSGGMPIDAAIVGIIDETEENHVRE